MNQVGVWHRWWTLHRIVLLLALETQFPLRRDYVELINKGPFIRCTLCPNALYPGKTWGSRSLWSTGYATLAKSVKSTKTTIPFSIYSMTFPFGTTGMGLTPIGVRPDHLITGANQRTLGAGNGERVGVDVWDRRKKVCKLIWLFSTFGSDGPPAINENIRYFLWNFAMFTQSPAPSGDNSFQKIATDCWALKLPVNSVNKSFQATARWRGVPPLNPCNHVFAFIPDGDVEYGKSFRQS